jgi:hypothetical protein
MPLLLLLQAGQCGGDIEAAEDSAATVSDIHGLLLLGRLGRQPTIRLVTLTQLPSAVTVYSSLMCRSCFRPATNAGLSAAHKAAIPRITNFKGSHNIPQVLNFHHQSLRPLRVLQLLLLLLLPLLLLLLQVAL